MPTGAMRVVSVRRDCNSTGRCVECRTTTSVGEAELCWETRRAVSQEAMIPAFIYGFDPAAPEEPIEICLQLWGDPFVDPSVL